MPMLVLAAGCVLGGCRSEPPENVLETAADSVGVAPEIALADIEGTWTMQYTPVSGTADVTTSQVRVTAGGWTLILPDRDSIPAEVTAAGDSLIVVEGPYESLGRPGTTVTMSSVYRLDGDRLVGVVAARYGTGGGGSPIVMLSEGRREP
jgi:hypothetical protein